MKFFQQYFTRTAALFLCCCFVLSCENDIKDVNALLTKKNGVEEAIQVESYLSEAGKVRAKLTSPFMLRHVADRDKPDSSFMEFPKTLRVDFYDDSTKVESVLTALYAKYMESQRKVFLKDSVTVINLNTGDTLRSQELWWDQNKEEFYTDKPAQTHQRNGNILYYQNGLRAAQDLSWRETYGVKGKVNASEGGIQ